MAQLTGTRHTYMDTVRREDLLDKIMDISPDMNYLTTIFSTVDVAQTFHEWSEYYEARPTSNSKTVEGDDNVFADLAQPSKKSNICQIIKEVFAVSETDIAVKKVSPQDAYAVEQAKAMRRWKNKAEFAVYLGTKASGSSGVAREMDGIRNTIVTDGLFTARASGTSLSIQELRDMVTASWNKTDEYLVDLLLTTGTRKGDFAAFFTNSTPRTIDQADKRLVMALDVIETDYGSLLEIRAHKDTLTNECVLINKSLCHVGYLRRPVHKPNSVSGDNEKGHIVGELTAQVDTARAMVVRNGYNLT